MRIISSEAIDALNAGRYGVSSLIKLMPSGTDPLCFWDGVGALSYGGDTYTGAARRFTLEPVPSVSDLSVQALRLNFSGLDSAVIAMIDGVAWHQQPMALYRILFADDYVTILSVDLRFSGFMDRIKWDEAADGSPSLLQLYCESASRELSRSGSRTASDADQRQRDPDDGFFSFAASSATSTMDWGRAPSTAAPTKSRSFLDKIF